MHIPFLILIDLDLTYLGTEQTAPTLYQIHSESFPHSHYDKNEELSNYTHAQGLVAGNGNDKADREALVFIPAQETYQGGPTSASALVLTTPSNTDDDKSIIHLAKSKSKRKSNSSARIPSPIHDISDEDKPILRVELYKLRYRKRVLRVDGV